MEAVLFTTDKGEGPLLCPCIASGLLIPVSTMADDLTFTPQLDQDVTALISLPFRQSGSYCVQMKGKDPLHIKDCIELGQWLSTVPERKGSWSSIVQKGRRFYHRTVVLDQSDYEVPCQSLGWMLEELFQPSESSGETHCGAIAQHFH